MLPSEIVFGEAIVRLFAAPTDPMGEVERRAAALFPGLDPVVWEGEAATFQFTYVGAAAERIFGYPARRWVDEPAFWSGTIVHPADRADAVAYCALATGKGRDHTFEYRALTRDGAMLWIRDLVQVIRSRRGVPERLRGVMFDVTAARRADPSGDFTPAFRDPTLAALGD